jgi:hypothetical protein
MTTGICGKNSGLEAIWLTIRFAGNRRRNHVTASSTIDGLKRLPIREATRRSNPLPMLPNIAFAEPSRGRQTADTATDEPEAAVARQSAQLPAFAPLLDDIEIAGWSSHRRLLSGNFHDWLMLDGRVILVMVGQAVGPAPLDATEAALVAQSAWATIRAHALHVRDAGQLVTIASRSLWPVPNAAVQASVAIALVDTAEGQASLAMAGDCLAWRIRAALTERLALDQPMLGAAADFTYASQSVQLALRERLVLVADDPLSRAPKLPPAIASGFARLDAESHRRMMATDAVALVRRQYERGAEDLRPAASVVAVRRR